MINVLVAIIVLQTALRWSRWKNPWLCWGLGLVVGLVVYASINTALQLSKPLVAAWLSDKAVLQDIAVLCLLDALLMRVRWYPGLLIFPATCYALVQCLFMATGVDFLWFGLLFAAVVALGLPVLSAAFSRLLPLPDDRRSLHFLLTIFLCLLALFMSSHVSTPVLVYQHQNIIMQYISQTLFGIANMLLIPDILLLIVFFVRALVLLFTTYGQYVRRRRDGYSSLYAKYRTMLYEHEPDEAYADFVATQFEAEGAKDVNLSRLLTKLGPVLGLIGTLISMSPALVGLSTGDISGMAYNMQVVFSATVVGLVISVVGLFTQQLKSRWYAKDLGRLDYVSRLFVERHEKEA